MRTSPPESVPARIEHVSDTARWVAVYRALESERADALFHDPFARRLAGARGKEISEAMPSTRHVARSVVTRTVVIDRWITEAVERRGVTMVIDLAAGLDARPWRMQLPASVRWVDVDLAGILDYKLQILNDVKPLVRYEPVRADLTRPDIVEPLLARLASTGETALVLTEGLLIYLGDDDVARLASALHAHEQFKWWITDLASPLLLQFVAKSRGDSMRNAPFRFAPADGTGFFAKFGWHEERFISTTEEARRLGRPMPRDWMMRLMARLAPEEKVAPYRRMSGIVMMSR